MNLPSVNFLEITTLPASAYRLVKLTTTANEVELASDPFDQIVGVLPKRPIAAGAKVMAVPSGPVKLIASGAVVAGEPLVPAAAGAVSGAAGDVEGRIVGFALESAADGNDFWAIFMVTPAVHLDYTVNAEAGNAVTVDVVGNPVNAGAKRYFARALSPTGAESANYTLSETGAGAEVNTAGGPGLLFSLSSAGVAQITVTDVSTTATETMILELIPAGHDGPSLFIPILFA